MSILFYFIYIYIFGLDKSIGLEYYDQRVARKSRYEYFFYLKNYFLIFFTFKKYHRDLNKLLHGFKQPKNHSKKKPKLKKTLHISICFTLGKVKAKKYVSETSLIE
jgi:hypothetical protein